MRFGIPHVVIACALLAACEPSWQGGAPVVRGDRFDSRCGGSVRVSAGDTVFGLARRCNVPVRDLIEANRLQPPFILRSGDVIRLPGGQEHIVRRGDTLSALARQYRVDFQTLARTNDKGPPYTIFVGEHLRIPGSYQQASATPPPRPADKQEAMVIPSPNTAGPQPPPVRGDAAPPPPPPADIRHPAFQPQTALPPDPPPLAGKGFVWPVRGEVVSDYGPLAKGQNNDGINIAAARGTPVVAAENGVVAYAGNGLKGFGNLLLLKHDDGWMTAYAHADQLLVTKGQTVKRGQQIATVGATGNVSSPQLHFEVRKGTEAMDPKDYLPGHSISMATFQ